MKYLKKYKVFESLIPPTFKDEDISNICDILIELDIYGVDYLMYATGTMVKVDDTLIYSPKYHKVISNNDDPNIDFIEYKDFTFAVGKGNEQGYRNSHNSKSLSSVGEEVYDVIERIFNYLINHGAESSRNFGYIITLRDSKLGNIRNFRTGDDNKDLIGLPELKIILNSDEFNITEIIVECD
jgi:hypothetical protein